VELSADEFEPDIDAADVLLEPEEADEAPGAFPAAEQTAQLAPAPVSDLVSILEEDDTYSPPPLQKIQAPPETPPPSQAIPAAAREIRQALEATGDLRPAEAAETFMIPPDNLVQTTPAADVDSDVDSVDLDDFETADDDSLDLDSDPDSLNLGASLDDLDDE
jgi:hypothetical protein